jgi:hypothetical protein
VLGLMHLPVQCIVLAVLASHLCWRTHHMCFCSIVHTRPHFRAQSQGSSRNRCLHPSHGHWHP